MAFPTVVIGDFLSTLPAVFSEDGLTSFNVDNSIHDAGYLVLSSCNLAFAMDDTSFLTSSLSSSPLSSNVFKKMLVNWGTESQAKRAEEGMVDFLNEGVMTVSKYLFSDVIKSRSSLRMKTPAPADVFVPFQDYSFLSVYKTGMYFDKLQAELSVLKNRYQIRMSERDTLSTTTRALTPEKLDAVVPYKHFYVAQFGVLQLPNIGDQMAMKLHGCVKVPNGYFISSRFFYF